MKQLSSFALAALSRAEVDGLTVRITEQLDRKLYVEVDKALQALGGKWNRKQKAHVFSGIPYTPQKLIEDLLAAEGYVDKKKELQQFFTPAAIADLLVKLADVRPGHRVLEPSAGRGALLEAVARVTKKLTVVAVEIDRANYEHLLKHCQVFDSTTIMDFDFLSGAPSSHQFDRIIMNPPFAKHADVEHVLHAWKFLKPGGRLVAVMSEHVTFAQDRTCSEFRAFAAAHAPDTIGYPGRPCGDGGFFPLPEKTFAESGTGVCTVILVLEKPL